MVCIDAKRGTFNTSLLPHGKTCSHVPTKVIEFKFTGEITEGWERCQEKFSLNKNSTRFQFRAITPADLMKARQKFKVSKSFGIDGISSYFLKIGISVLAPVLSTIFNRSISEGVFPNNWKVARVAPIYKRRAY